MLEGFSSLQNVQGNGNMNFNEDRYGVSFLSAK